MGNICHECTSVQVKSSQNTSLVEENMIKNSDHIIEEKL
jgi:hypothetical protein